MAMVRCVTVSSVYVRECICMKVIVIPARLRVRYILFDIYTIDERSISVITLHATKLEGYISAISGAKKSATLYNYTHPGEATRLGSPVITSEEQQSG